MKTVYLVEKLALFCLCALLLTLLPAQASQIKVALFVDSGASTPSRRNFKALLSDSDDIQYETIYGDDIRAGSLKNFDALLVPGGSATKEAFSMGPDAREEVRRFVHDGGIYMGVCAGAYLSSQTKDVFLGLLPLKTLDSKHWHRVSAGVPLNIELTPMGMDVFQVNRPNIKIVYENGPIFGPPQQKPDDSLVPLGFFRDEVVAPGGERGVMLGAPAMVLSRYGRGIVLAISPHPEKTPGHKQMLLHALQWLYEHRPDIPPTSSGDASETRAVAVEQHTDSELGNKMLQLAESVFDQATIVRYVHRHVPASQQVMVEPDGSVKANTDCSGFISYLVNAVAPRHYQVIRSKEPNWSYPQAKIWARFFNTLDGNTPHHGWLGISRWQDLQPGDIIAWLEGNPNSRNTGHVMMVEASPNGPQQINGFRYIDVPVIDSSSVYHFAPEALPPLAHQQRRNGLGKGTVRIILSDTDAPIGYWPGTFWGEGDKPVKGPTFSKMVRFARMVPLRESDG